MAWDPKLKARPTVYNGIQMRSRLEAGYAAWLDLWGFTWRYEPCAFASAGGRQYLPDFVIRDVKVGGRPVPVDAYVEVKPAEWNVDGDSASRMRTLWSLTERMAVILDSEPDAVLLLEFPTPDDASYASTALVERNAVDGRYYPMSSMWCHPGRRSSPHERPTLARPLSRFWGPWYADWWKGQVVG